MATVYLALGSNIGDSRQHIQNAIGKLAVLLQDLKSAPLYQSKAIGYTDQPDFLNTVVRGGTALAPAAFLQRIKAVEQEVGRTPTFRWGPREIDIDIIFYDDLVLKTPGLTIPHPEFTKRDFVLQPLCDLKPDLVDPVSRQTVKVLLDQLRKTQQSPLKRVD